jgi:hypothetical protein
VARDRGALLAKAIDDYIRCVVLILDLIIYITKDLHEALYIIFSELVRSINS